MTLSNYTKAIALGIKFVSSQQNTLGEFKNEDTNFVPAVIAMALSKTKNPLAQEILKNIAKLLIKNQAPSGTFNYWSKPTQHPKQEQYPNDWDDTSLAHAAIMQAGIPIRGKTLANLLNKLRADQLRPGGPFVTWITPNKNAIEFDIVVNANVAYFLSLLGAQPKKLYEYLNHQILQQKFASPYYASPAAVIYFLSRIKISARAKGILLSHILSLKKPNGSFGNVLDTALTICSLLRFGYPVKKLSKSISFLLKHQRTSGEWDKQPFVVEKIVGNTKYFKESAVLTSAVCIESLTLANSTTTQTTLSNQEQRFHTTILTSFKRKIRCFPKEIRKALNIAMYKTLTNGAKTEVVLLPLWIASLYKKQPAPLTTLKKLSEANLWGWIAYRIYDDLLDNQGHVKNLSTANIALLKLSALYLTIPNRKIQNVFLKTMITVEKANAHESSQNIQLSKNGIHLANKSLSAALSALAITLTSGYSTRSSEYKALLKFFRHYLALRQLNDDAHDWLDDLHAGKINFVASLLVSKKCSARFLLSQKTKSQKVFWRKAFPHVLSLCNHHLHLARKNVNKLPSGKYKHRLEEMLTPFAKILRESELKQQQTIEFLNHF